MDTKSYQQKILNSLTEYLLLKILNRSTVYVRGITGKDLMLHLRAMGATTSDSKIYSILAKLQREKILVKVCAEIDDYDPKLAYFMTESGEKYFQELQKLVIAISR